MKKAISLLLLFFLTLCVAVSGCLSNIGNSADHVFEPDNFLKLTNLSEDNTTLTMIFDEDFDSDFRWKLTMDFDDVLNLSEDEIIIYLDDELEKHKWVFEGNTTGTVWLNFSYINPENYTAERYTYRIENTNGNLEILCIDSYSGNRTPLLSIFNSERVELADNNTSLALLFGESKSRSKVNNTWKLEENPAEILNKISEDELPMTSDDDSIWRAWVFGGENPGNVILTLNCSNKDGDSIAEVIYEIHVNENKEISIRNASYNTIK